MNRAKIAAALLLGLGFFGSARAGGMQPPAQTCLVQVLSSEEIPLGPMFYHTVKATLLITPQGNPGVVRTVERAIPWQVPPPRQSQRLRMACDPARLESVTVFER